MDLREGVLERSVARGAMTKCWPRVSWARAEKNAPAEENLPSIAVRPGENEAVLQQ